MGRFETADKSNTAPKCTIVGVANAGSASAARGGDLSAISVRTTNCNPISAPADEPTIIKKLFHAERSDILFTFLQLVALFDKSISKSLETVGQFRAFFSLVCELSEKQCKTAPCIGQGLGDIVGVAFKDGRALIKKNDRNYRYNKIGERVSNPGSKFAMVKAFRIFRKLSPRALRRLLLSDGKRAGAYHLFREDIRH